MSADKVLILGTNTANRPYQELEESLDKQVDNNRCTLIRAYTVAGMERFLEERWPDSVQAVVMRYMINFNGSRIGQEKDIERLPLVYTTLRLMEIILGKEQNGIFDKELKALGMKPILLYNGDLFDIKHQADMKWFEREHPNVTTYHDALNPMWDKYLPTWIQNGYKA